LPDVKFDVNVTKKQVKIHLIKVQYGFDVALAYILRLKKYFFAIYISTSKENHTHLSPLPPSHIEHFR